jgi:ABC-type nitrate/sulfonate/bicarbonate transport system permease component
MRRAHGRRISWRRWLRWTLSITVFMVMWEWIGRSGSFFVIRPPSEVLPILGDELAKGDLLRATAGTLAVAAVGFVLGAVIGIVVGVLTGVSERWAQVVDPLVNAAYSAPVVMLIPVIAIYAGLEFKGKVVLVVLFNVFVVIINTSVGVREVPESLKEMALAFGTSRSKMYRRIVFPWASPYVLTGLRLGIGRSVQGAILADLFLRADNLGLYIVQAAGSFDLDRLLAAVFFVTILAAGTMLVMRGLEWWALRWKVA